MFEKSHQHLIDNLDLDDDKLKEELKLDLFDDSREFSDSITEEITKIP